MPTARQRTERTFFAEAFDGWRRARVRWTPHEKAHSPISRLLRFARCTGNIHVGCAFCRILLKNVDAIYARLGAGFYAARSGWRRTRVCRDRGEEAHSRIRKYMGFAPRIAKLLRSDATRRKLRRVNLLSGPRTQEHTF
jgi:hypothetical protein